jgi:hypothetical protein
VVGVKLYIAPSLHPLKCPGHFFPFQALCGGLIALSTSCLQSHMSPVLSLSLKPSSDGVEIKAQSGKLESQPAKVAYQKDSAC